jgi:predicted anti-sigma-YlaC factor YlaD
VSEQEIPVSCAEVFREISDYIEGEIDPEVQARMEAHFKECAHCTAILDGMNNVIRLVGDGRAFEVPREFSKRMYLKLERYWAQGGSKKPE